MHLWILSALAISVLSTNEVCPGGSFSCPDTATCCQLSDLSYGCCPMQNAVCCDDHIHCCPQNTKCDAGMCIQLNSANMTAKKAFFVKDKEIKCFGSEYKCPDDTTCCKGKSPGTYGCCPMKDAVCCSDGYHCCPKNTVCDLQAEKCVGKDVVFEMYDSQKSVFQKYNYALYRPLAKPLNAADVVCPGSGFTCPSDYTCCKLASGDWGCCPFPKATCCSDHLHCCPENMKCNNDSQSCTQGHVSMPSLLKKLAKPANVVAITCPDNSTCADTMTCCALRSQRYGCCAYDNAVCCEDHEHCCPNGFVCDTEEKRCIKPKENWLFNVISKYYEKLG